MNSKHLFSAKNQLLFTLIAFSVLVLVFVPFLELFVVHHDNTRYFHESLADTYKAQCANDSQYIWLWVIGRPLAAIIECEVFQVVRGPESLKILRYLCVGFLAVLCVQFYNASRAIGHSTLTLMSVAILLATMPVFQNAILMTNFVNILASILSVAAGTFFINRSNARNISLRFYLGVGVAIFVSQNMYPTLSFLFFVPFCLLLLSKNLVVRSVLQLLVQAVVLFFLTSACYILFNELIIQQLSFLPNRLVVPVHYEMVTSIALILSNFWHRLPLILTVAFSAHAMTLYENFGIVSLILNVVILLLKAPFRNFKEFKKYAFRIFMFIFLLIVSSAPLYLTSSGEVYLRLYGPVTAVAIVFMVWNFLDFIERLRHSYGARVEGARTCFVGGAAIVALFQVAATSLLVAIDVYEERKFVQTQIAELGQIPERVHVVLAEQPNPLGVNGRRGVGDEFFSMTSNFTQNIPNLVRIALLELYPHDDLQVASCPLEATVAACVVGLSGERVMVTVSEAQSDFCMSTGMAIVDFNVLLRASRFSEMEYAPPDNSAMENCHDLVPFTFETTATSSGYHLGNAFDGSVGANSFWEASFNESTVVFLTFRHPVSLTNLELFGGVAPDRMPQRFSIYAGTDLVQDVIIREGRFDEWHEYGSQAIAIDSEVYANDWRLQFLPNPGQDILRVYEIMVEWE